MAVMDVLRAMFPPGTIGRALNAGPVSFGGSSGPGWSSYGGSSSPSYQGTVRAYQGNEIVSSAVNLLATSASEPHIIGRRYRRNRPQVRAQMRALNAAGMADVPGRWQASAMLVRNGFWEELDGHPLVTLLNQPNPYQDRAEFWGQLVQDYYLAGNCFALKARYSSGLLAGAVGELWRLRPDRVKPIPGDMSKGEPYLKGYSYQVDATTSRIIPVEDILHWKTTHPLNPYEGCSPIIAALDRVDIDSAMRLFLRTFYRRGGASVGGSLNIKGGGTLDQGQKDDIRQRFRSIFNGGQYDILVTTAEDISYTPFGLDRGIRDAIPRDIDAVNEARIAMVLRIPPGILGLLIGMETSSYANQRQAWASLWYVTMTPLLSRFEAVLNRALVPEFSGIDEVVFDLSDITALREDEDALQERARKNYAAGLAGFHESRVKLGYSPELEPGELIALPSTSELTPVEWLPDGSKPQPPQLPAPSDTPPPSGPQARAGRPRLEDDPAVRELYEESQRLRALSMSWAQIAERLGVAERTLRGYRSRFDES